jgi:hypothetical protein
MLATLLLTALFSRPSAPHAAFNALQCSAAATALHTLVRPVPTPSACARGCACPASQRAAQEISLSSEKKLGHNDRLCSVVAPLIRVCVFMQLAMVFQRVEQMQSMSYLRRVKGIRNLRKRRTVASCYHGIATALEVIGNIVCAFGTYLIMLYWLKFGAMPDGTRSGGGGGGDGMQPYANGAAQYWWLASASAATLLNGVLWGRARRFLPCFRRPDGTARRYADIGFILVLAATFYVLLFYVYRLLPPPPTPMRAAAGDWLGSHPPAAGSGRSFTDPTGAENVFF